MSNKVTVGGERLGNGKKIKVDLHGWGRSTFDQSRIWRSTMGVGILTPCFNEIGLPGTTFDIDINTLGHTIPTISPLFGSFKLQVDLFACPIRLYQGLLHNNAVNIGLEMSQVLLPQIEIGKGANISENNKLSTSSLNNYLGIKGRTEEMNTFNALRHIAYYDIFKNYYANKQEENAKAIGNVRNSVITDNVQFAIQEEEVLPLYFENDSPKSENTRRIVNGSGGRITNQNAKVQNDTVWKKTENENKIIIQTELHTTNEDQTKKAFIIQGNFNSISYLLVETDDGTLQSEPTLRNVEFKGKSALYDEDFRIAGYVERTNNNTLKITINYNTIIRVIQWEDYEETFDIQDFPLENIDDARREILKKTNLNQRIVLNNDLNFLPYSLNFENQSTMESEDKTFQGLCLKTYQNDIFNCWLNSEYVEKINNLTSITPDSEGNISIDAFILAKKVYNIMNRIAINGGTYQDWQESVWGEKAGFRNESPIYIGGTSAEITFEEVVATTKATEQPLGTLGGKGIMTNRKGGNIIYKCEEPCIIMGIASITPRLDYHQGNDWFMTNIENMDNLHKPGLDGIGFQDLIENNVIWQGSPNVSLAKQTAWIQYQTAFNEVFGQFAEEGDDSLQHMVLRRNFEVRNGEIQDFTSYIDPSKFNYAFADDTLKAQNFWMQIGFNVKSRRKMAANEIPNL